MAVRGMDFFLERAFNSFSHLLVAVESIKFSWIFLPQTLMSFWRCGAGAVLGLAWLGLVRFVSDTRSGMSFKAFVVNDMVLEG